MHYGKEKADRITRDMVNNLKPVVTDGHLALARANGAGEYWLTLNNYVNLTLNVKLAGGPIDFFALDPVAMFFGQVGINSKAPHPNAAKLAANFLLSQQAQAFYTKFGRLPTRSDVTSNPRGRGRDAQEPQGRARAVQSGGGAHVAEEFRVHLQAALGHGSIYLVLLCS